MRLGDLRNIGSGNIGATNVLRTGNKFAAALTLVCDFAKGAIPVFAAKTFVGDDAAQIAALSAFLGHLFPVWYRFRGGKGVATFLGVIVPFSPIAWAAVCLTWLAVAIPSRLASLSSLVAAVSAPIWISIFGIPHNIPVFTVMAILIWVGHRTNISRLINGTESKISFSNPSKRG